MYILCVKTFVGFNYWIYCVNSREFHKIYFSLCQYLLSASQVFASPRPNNNYFLSFSSLTLSFLQSSHSIPFYSSLPLSYTYTLTILLSLPLLSYMQTLFSFTLSQIHTHARAHTEFVCFFFLLPHVFLSDSHYSSLYFCIVYLCRYAGARIEVFPTVFRTRLYMADVRRHKTLAIYLFCIQ